MENVAKGHELSTTHGLARTHEWNAWMSMKRRVLYECASNRSSKYYIDKGIKIHPEWVDNFEDFLGHIGKAPSKEHTVGRIDGNKDYVPGNVRWETYEEQNRNKSDNVIVEWLGRQMTLVEACETSVVPYQTAWYRIQRAGWSAERALTQPVKYKS